MTLRKIYLVFVLLTSLCLCSMPALCKNRKPIREFKNQITVSNGLRVHLGHKDAYGRIEHFGIPKGAVVLGEQQAIGYQRTLSKSVGVAAIYTYWLGRHEGWNYPTQTDLPDTTVGLVTSRQGYRQFDLLFSYRHKIYDRHSLSLSVGPSFAIGWDGVVVKTAVIFPYSHYTPPYVYEHQRIDNNRWGAAAQLRYDYALRRGRYNVGGNFELRTYQTFPKPMLYYGIHGSWNF
jgi:hypothetical protein